MRIERTVRFKRDFKGLPESLKRRAEKQLTLLFQNPSHPSLRIKKMEGSKDIWEGRITKAHRFTFQIREDTCLLRRIESHDILKTP